MTQTEASNLELINHRRLPRRDWILLPLIAFLTICLITFSAALIARWLFAESKTRLANCMILDDPSTGPRGIPNCSVKEKLPETGLVQFGLNSAGYRAGMDLGPKLPGTYRIVMTGSSIALGERIEREESFATLLPIELSRRTGRSIELYNESMGWGFARNTSLRFGDVLKAKPDLILWAHPESVIFITLHEWFHFHEPDHCQEVVVEHSHKGLGLYERAPQYEKS
jgi:hypothetical protein